MRTAPESRGAAQGHQRCGPGVWGAVGEDPAAIGRAGAARRQSRGAHLTERYVRRAVAAHDPSRRPHCPRAAAGACAHIAAPSARCPRRKSRRRRAGAEAAVDAGLARARLGVGVRPRARACGRAHERMTTILDLSDISARRRTRSRREQGAPVTALAPSPRCCVLRILTRTRCIVGRRS